MSERESSVGTLCIWQKVLKPWYGFSRVGVDVGKDENDQAEISSLRVRAAKDTR